MQEFQSTPSVEPSTVLLQPLEVTWTQDAGQEPCIAAETAFRAAQAVDLFPASALYRARFRPACVKTSYLNGDLWVYADLEDEHIYNTADRLNLSTCELGDVFEMFFHPDGQATYTELHVTPENQHLQLQFPSVDALQASDNFGQFKSWLLWGEVFGSWTLVEVGRWRVVARVPLELLCDSAEILREVMAGEREILFSYCRYDYSPGELPVLSSTSTHEEVSFHRLHEWRRMRLAAP